MIINKKVLLCGLGRMGRIHKKYLDILSIENYWYDPFVDSTDNNRVSNLDSIKDLDIDRVVIATPEGTHHSVYKKIKKIIPSAMFLVEKPAILDIKNIDMLEDPNVLVGLVERFNPVVQTLRSVIDVEKIINIDFVRCSVSNISNQRVSSFADVGIHDIDLLYFLLNEKNICFELRRVANTYTMTAKPYRSNKRSYRFLWSNDTFSKERKITVRQNDCTYTADLIDQKLIRHSASSKNNGIVCENIYVEKSSSVKEQMINFLKDDPIPVRAIESHATYLKALKDENK